MGAPPRLAVQRRPLPRAEAALPARRRGRVRDDRVATAPHRPRAGDAVLPTPRPGGARWHPAPPQARISPRAGRADPGAARAGARRGRDRAGLARERSAVAAMDGGRLLEAEFRDRLPAAAQLTPGTARQVFPRRRTDAPGPRRPRPPWSESSP